MRRLALVVLCSCIGVTVWSSYPATSSATAQAGFRSSDREGDDGPGPDDAVDRHSQRMVADGRKIFRFDTFGDEAFWGDTLRLHDAIKGRRLGGVGPGLTPRAALAVGLKVDAERLPDGLVAALKRGTLDLDDPASTVQLLRLNAVVGLTGFFEKTRLRSVGIQCALCHSTVDDGLAPGIGRRLDGWANRDLNVGAVVALAPNLQPIADLLGTDQATVRAVLNSWGPGKFDAELILDGKAFRPDGRSAATLLPPAFGLAGVNLHTWTGWGGVTHWNAFVANLEMHGQGTFFDPRLDDALQFPVAAKAGFGNVRSPSRSDHVEAGGAPVLSTRDSRAATSVELLQSRSGTAWKGCVQRASGLRDLSCAAALHGAGMEFAYAAGDRDRQLPGRSVTGSSLPDVAAQGTVDPHEGRVLPRRPLRDPSRCGRPLRQHFSG